MTEYWVSSKKITVWVKVDRGGKVASTANITKKFIGQKFTNLLNWMRYQGDLRIELLNK
jgi:hypothetical protein